jgi:glutamyl-Q tRNA(Asp) synthetase
VPYCGRFAPSPTGPLHFGSLVAAVASYADAHAAGGAWLLRIEDVDEPRARRGAEASIRATLARHGFVADGEVLRQSARTACYEAALSALRTRGLVYACACTRRELAFAPRRHDDIVYPGTCRHGIDPARAARRARSWRFRMPDGTIGFDDRVQGRREYDLAREIGDVVVRRADGWFSYQLAVVVDDAAQGVTDVVRGADLIASTPRQIALQHALGLATPRYLHVPVALDAQGRKLSKQNDAPALAGDPVAALLAAWRFLRQPAPLASPSSVGAFWAHASRAWSPARVPAQAALVADAAV